MFQSIIVGTDGSDGATRAVRAAAALGTPGETRLHVVSVAKPAKMQALAAAENVPTAAFGTWEDAAKETLETVLERAAGLGTRRRSRGRDPHRLREPGRGPLRLRRTGPRRRDCGRQPRHARAPTLRAGQRPEPRVAPRPVQRLHHRHRGARRPGRLTVAPDAPARRRPWQGAEMDLPVTPPWRRCSPSSPASSPTGDGWSYEPKWDGFRCVVFRDHDEIELGSRNGRPLNRYFPEILDPLRAALPERGARRGARHRHPRRSRLRPALPADPSRRQPSREARRRDPGQLRRLRHPRRRRGGPPRPRLRGPPGPTRTDRRRRAPRPSHSRDHRPRRRGAMVPGL